MRTWQSIGKICLKYCVLNIILAALMLATTVLSTVQPSQTAMADTPDIIEQFADFAANASLPDINTSQFNNTDTDNEAGEDDASGLPDSVIEDISYDNFQAFQDSLRRISDSTNTGENSVNVINQVSQVNQGASNSVSEPENMPNVTALVTPGQDVDIELNSSNRNLRLHIPNGAADQDMEVEIIDHGSSGSKGSGMLSVFEMNAVATSDGSSNASDNKSASSYGVGDGRGSGENKNIPDINQSDKSNELSKDLRNFNKGLTLTIQHSPEELAGLNTYTLKLYYLDENTLQWVPVPDSAFDSETYTLTATIEHFSYYGEMADPIIIGPGRVMAFQNNLHSGAATYSYPIEVPDGTGGLQPDINLIYNSGSIDEMKNKKDVGSWVGIGWSLSMGYVSYDPISKNYYLSLDGMSNYEIIEDADGNYHTIPESFYSITRGSAPTSSYAWGLAEKWVIYDRDGIRYEFGGTDNSQRFYFSGHVFIPYTTYRYDLNYISDTNGNDIEISYNQDIWCFWANGWYTPGYSVRSSYPEHVQYNDGLVDVYFNTSYDIYDPPNSGGSGYGYFRIDNPQQPGLSALVMENGRLNYVEVKVDGNLVRKYEFTHDTTPAYETDDYGECEYSGTYTLTSITEFGADGVSSLPATTFEYTDLQINCYDSTDLTYKGNPGNPASLTWPYLTSSTNGYGATTNFTYSEKSIDPSWIEATVGEEIDVDDAPMLTAAWYSPDGDVFVSEFDYGPTGTQSNILHYDGLYWAEMETNNTNILWDIWGSDSSNVFAVGDNGTIIYYDGSNWSQMNSNTSEDLMGVGGTSASDVYATGANGTILHYNGLVWSTMDSSTSSSLNDVWVFSASNIYAVGVNGTIMHYNGSAWSPVYVNSSATLDGVWGSSPLDVFVVGSYGTVLHYNGSAWISMDSGAPDTQLFRVWGASSTDVFVGSVSNEILHYNGSAWSVTDTGTSDSWVLGICGNSAGEVYAVGIQSGEGFVVKYNGLSWDQVPNTSPWLSAICALSDDDIFAGTFDGRILHYNGYSWTEMYSTESQTIWGFWSESSSNIFAVGGSGTILHYDGSTWTPMSSGTTQDLHGVYGWYFTYYGVYCVYAVGASGTILHYQSYPGTGWTSIESGTTQYLNDVYCIGGTGVYVVGSEGTILYGTSGCWTPCTFSAKISNTSYTLYGVWGSSSGEIFAVGGHGTILNSCDSGNTWTTMDSGTEDVLFFRVWGTSELNVFAVGIPDVIYHYDGVNWTDMDSGTEGAWLIDVSGSSSEDVYVAGVGSGGGILLKCPYNNMWSRQVVTSMTMDPEIGNQQTYEYTYTGDPQYFKVGPGAHPWDDEYRGFPQVRVTDAEGNYTEHYFWTTGSGEAEILSGREYLTEWYDSSDQLLESKEYTWDYRFTENEAEDLCPGAIGYWNMDEDSGQTVHDSSGDHDDGILGAISEPAWTTSGRFGNALVFDGQNDYVALPGSSSLSVSGSFSIEAWVKRNSLNTGDCILAAGNGNTDKGQQQYILYINNGSEVVFQMKGTSSGQFVFGYLSSGLEYPVGDSSWHHIAVTSNTTPYYYYGYRYDVKIYIDGIKKANGIFYGLPASMTVNDRRIGSISGGADFFDGIIDDVRIYGRDLSAEEIRQEAKLSSPFVYLEEVTDTIDDKTSRTRYVYDEYGNLVTEYVDGDLDTASDDRTVHRVYYPNTSANILNKPARESMYSTITDDIGGANLSSETLYYYDGNNTTYNTSPSKGNPTRIESKVNANSSVSAYYTYDIYGNVLTEQDANENVWQTTYDTTYHIYPVNISSPMEGQYETYSFDPGTGNLLSRTDVNDQTTNYQYDVFGRMTKVIRVGDTNESPSVEYQYNNWGNLSQQHLKTLTKVNTSDYLWSSQYFDGFGRVIQTQSRGEEGYIIVDTTTEYNSRGLADKVYVPQVLNSSQVNGYVTPQSSWKYSSSTYDALGRVINSTAADNTSTSMDYSVPWQTTVTNPNGYKHTYYYDAFNELIQVDEMDDSDELYASTMYDYDTLGNLVQVEDADSNITTMTYDWLGRKTAMSDPDMGDWSYEYDNNGNLISQTDNKSQTVTLTYDALNRITAKLYPEDSGMPNVSYSYDDTTGGNYGVGRLTAVEDEWFAPTTYQYDERGRLTTEYRFSTFSTYYEYDAGDRLTSVTYPTEEVVTQTYNSRGLPNTLSGNVSGDLVTGTTYNELGQITRIDYGNGDYDTYAYYGLDGEAPSGYWGRLWQIQSGNSSDTLQDIRYTWDANGNMLTRQDYLASETEAFTYDFLDRLTSASSSNYSESYAYNEIGNIISMNGVNYTYGGSQPHAVTSVGNTSYAYDANGNMITRGDQTITWNLNNMPVLVTDGVDTSQFIYDGNGVRALKYDGGEYVMYVNQYHELNFTTGEVTSHYYLGGREVAYKVDDDLRFVHQDSLGSTSLTTSATGAIVASVKYMPYGVRRNSQGTLDTDKLFTGQRLDDTGLYYYNARYYDATIGRFISADTIVPDYMNPQSLNRYSYCVNNPLKYVDPSGHLNEEDYPASEGWHPVVVNGKTIGYQRWKNHKTGDWCYPVYNDAGQYIQGAWISGPGTAPGWTFAFDSEGHLVPGAFYNTDTGEYQLPPQSWWQRNGKWVIVGISCGLFIVTGAGLIAAGYWLGTSATVAATGGIALDTTNIFTIVGSGYVIADHALRPWVIAATGALVAGGGSGATIYYGGVKGGLSTAPSYKPGNKYPTTDSSVSLVDSYALYQQIRIQQNMEESLGGVDYDSPYYH